MSNRSHGVAKGQRNVHSILYIGHVVCGIFGGERKAKNVTIVCRERGEHT